MPKTIEQQIDALYRELPTINCRKLCHGACGPIGMTKLELARIESRRGSIQNVREMPIAFSSGQSLGQGLIIDCATCPMLKSGLCSVYDIRPLICRTWGLVQDMRCPYGCTPSRWLSPRASHDLFSRAKRLSEKWERQQAEA